MESAEVNAFSHPGGYVYVNRGLFDLIGEDEDYALQFAVGNEMAHVDLQHAIRCLQDPDFKEMSGGTIRKLYWLILPFGYLGRIRITKRTSGHSPGCAASAARSARALAFLNKLDGYATNTGSKTAEPKCAWPPIRRPSSISTTGRQTAAWRRFGTSEGANQVTSSIVGVALDYHSD